MCGTLAGPQAAPAGAKQPASCLHLPVPRVLLITVVLALMAIPLLLFTAGRVQVSPPHSALTCATAWLHIHDRIRCTYMLQ